MNIPKCIYQRWPTYGSRHIRKKIIIPCQRRRQDDGVQSVRLDDVTFCRTIYIALVLYYNNNVMFYRPNKAQVVRTESLSQPHHGIPRSKRRTPSSSLPVAIAIYVDIRVQKLPPLLSFSVWGLFNCHLDPINASRRVCQCIIIITRNVYIYICVCVSLVTTCYIYCETRHYYLYLYVL